MSCGQHRALICISESASRPAVTQRDKTGLRQWIESGHLSLNPPHYQPTIQNWIQGITLGEVSVDGNDFELRPVPFRLSYRALVDGREFSA